MATTRQDIKGWIEEAKENGATFVVIVCDTWDYEDYPVEVKPTQDVREVVKHYNGPNMQKVMEVYDLNKDINQQLAMHRAGLEYMS